jgi:hypothetical protein
LKARLPGSLHAALIAMIALCASACSAMPSWVPGSSSHIPSSLDADEVPEGIREAEAALARNDAESAIEWMIAAAKATGTSVELRDRVQILLEQACTRRIEELSNDPDGADALADMVELDLPRQVSVQAGIRAAEMYLAEDEGLDAARLLQKLDKKFPLHYERQRAADIMCDVGLVAITDGPGFLGFFTDRDDGQGILEYIILNAPWARRADEAYRALAERYEKDGEWDLAIDRTQKLVLNHPASPLRVFAQAQVPRLRLDSIKSPEYDRIAIATARKEIEEWLAMYSGHELEPSVRIDLGDCLRRLSDNDMIVSRFYERVDNAHGARYHAERAIVEARDAGDEERVAEAQAWLDELPPDTDLPADHPAARPGPPAPAAQP